MIDEIVKGLTELRSRLTNLEETYENKFSELEEGDLKKSLYSLAERVKFPLKKITLAPS